MKNLTPAERLIVAADFKPEQPNGRNWVREQIRKLSKALKGLGVYIKLNSALRALGYDIIDEVHQDGHRVLADLKLIDIDKTLTIDGVLLQETKPELVTVMCVAGVPAMKALKVELPDTEVLGVTVLTSLTDDDAKAMFTCETAMKGVERFAHIGADAEIDGLISAATEVEMLRADNYKDGRIGMLMTLNTLAIQPEWAAVKSTHQNQKRLMTPAQAIKIGATRIVVGTAIIKDPDPLDAAMRTIEEIASAVG